MVGNGKLHVRRNEYGSGSSKGTRPRNGRWYAVRLSGCLKDWKTRGAPTAEEGAASSSDDTSKDSSSSDDKASLQRLLQLEVNPGRVACPAMAGQAVRVGDMAVVRT
jgi:hypothetical protein